MRRRRRRVSYTRPPERMTDDQMYDAMIKWAVGTLLICIAFILVFMVIPHWAVLALTFISVGVYWMISLPVQPPK